MSGTTMDIDGLKLVLAAGKAAPPERFDMGDFDCGTTACLIGWFCRENPDDDLKLRRTLDLVSPVFEGSCLNAVDRRFGLDDFQSIRLFYATKLNQSQAIERLEQFIKDHE